MLLTMPAASSSKQNSKRSPGKWRRWQSPCHLHSEAQAQLFGVPWRPAYEFKLAIATGLEGLANYATAMLGLVFYLPAVLLGLATILVGAALTWKLLRLGTRVLFGTEHAAGIQSAQSVAN